MPGKTQINAKKDNDEIAPRTIEFDNEGMNPNPLNFDTFVDKRYIKIYLDKKESNNSSSLEYALHKLLKPQGYIDDFISKIGSLMEKYELPIKDTKDNRKREVNNEIKLDLPYPSTEC